MSATQLSANVGKQAMLAVELSLTFLVKILDARQVYNRTDYLVTPANGTGQRWVSAERVTVLGS